MLYPVQKLTELFVAGKSKGRMEPMDFLGVENVDFVADYCIKELASVFELQSKVKSEYLKSNQAGLSGNVKVENMQLPRTHQVTHPKSLASDSLERGVRKRDEKSESKLERMMHQAALTCEKLAGPQHDGECSSSGVHLLKYAKGCNNRIVRS